MSSDNNIKHFTSVDIEKYHTGKLSAAEMHVMEKAAMDDPFLADALEGYSNAGANISSDINELKERLAKRIEGGKVVPIGYGKKSRSYLLRVAVLLFFIAGAGILIYQLGFNSKENKIAQNSETKSPANPVGSSNDSTVVDLKKKAEPSTTMADTDQTKTVSGLTSSGGQAEKNQTVKGSVSPEKLKEGKPTVTTEKEPDGVVVSAGKDVDAHKEATTGSAILVQPVTATPRSVEEDNKPGGFGDKSKDKKELAKEYKKVRNQDEFGLMQPADRELNNKTTAGNRRDVQQQNNSSSFRGRVTDRANTGVPFANVTNLGDNNAGTYTDARGYFNLTYPDSVLNVQVKSIGFENTNVQLRNNVPNNQVVLKDDHTTLNEVVLSKQNANAVFRKAGDNMKLEEPEPEDGWEKYDTYLVNNLIPPKDAQGKQTANGTVEVSFEVDKKGEPTNIKIEKSLCSSCDKEAVRLIKEGPKWKRKAKKGRTTVRIPF